MAAKAKRLIVYGGRGSLGTACVNHFKEAKYWIASIDFNPNEKADANIQVTNNTSWLEQEAEVSTGVADVLKGEKVDGLICVTGGWVRGNAANDLCKAAEESWKQTVWTSTIAASLATKHLDNGGLIALTGAKASLGPTPGMIGYGMAKAAVHQLTKSLGSPGSGLPERATAVAVLPVTLDTDANRKLFPKADFSLWTPLSYVCKLFEQWLEGKDRPVNGSLVTLHTKESQGILPLYNINEHSYDVDKTVQKVTEV